MKAEKQEYGCEVTEMKVTELTKEMRWHIADRLAEDRLETINASCQEAKVKKTFYTCYGKRCIDIILSGIALLITLPINVVLAICTFFDVGAPIFFFQERTGMNGKTFKIVKFRNMKNTVDERGELLPPSKRVTKFGKFVRKTSLDELLNFWSIFKGDMSLIGPRPLVPEYTNRLNKRHVTRQAVRPGLECPPKDDIDHVWSWHDQFENDVWYVENISFKTDLFMLWRLVKYALDRKSTKVRAAANRGAFMGYTEDGLAMNLSEVPQSYIDECEAWFNAKEEQSNKQEVLV